MLPFGHALLADRVVATVASVLPWVLLCGSQAPTGTCGGNRTTIPEQGLPGGASGCGWRSSATGASNCCELRLRRSRPPARNVTQTTFRVARDFLSSSLFRYCGSDDRICVFVAGFGFLDGMGGAVRADGRSVFSSEHSIMDGSGFGAHNGRRISYPPPATSVPDEQRLVVNGDLLRGEHPCLFRVLRGAAASSGQPGTAA